MELNFSLCLPRDVVSVPVVRRVLKASLNTLGVTADCVHDISLVLSEACTNVLEHAQEGAEYTVIARIVDDRCIIDVKDDGTGFPSDTGQAASATSAEDGRGLYLIRTLVDVFNVESNADGGTVVHVEKALALDEDSPLGMLTTSRSQTDPADVAG